MRSNLALATASVLLTVLAGNVHAATVLSLFGLEEGANIIQVTGALAANTDGGPSLAETRTIYYFEPDFGDAPPNEHDYTGGAWPYVYLDGPLEIDERITATVTTENDGFGEFVLINGNPLYQFVNDGSPTDANGNFGPWFYVLRDGTPTQDPAAVIPVPAALPLLATACGGLLLAGVRRRRALG